MTAGAQFRQRLLAGDLLTGTFIKTPHVSVIEALAGAGLDVLCLDAEHAPFDRGDLDVAILAARATGQAVLVRPPSNDPGQLLNALDLGAAGVLVPHVRSAAEAAAAVAACRYGPGGRGFVGLTRAAAYGGRGLKSHLEASASEVSVIAQIEDREALDDLGAIMATPGLDGIFIGRMDLTVALGETDPKAPAVLHAVEAILAAAVAAGRPAGLFTPDLGEIPHWRRLGARLFLLGSDHGFVRAGARADNVAGATP
jgi:staphyloferrin B biosynthesis citrate synthase